MDFDDILGHVGGWGKFQYRLLLISVPFTFFLAYVGYAPILFLYVPDHWCAIPENYKIALNTTDEEALINVLIPMDKGRFFRMFIYRLFGSKFMVALF